MSWHVVLCRVVTDRVEIWRGRLDVALIYGNTVSGLAGQQVIRYDLKMAKPLQYPEILMVRLPAGMKASMLAVSDGATPGEVARLAIQEFVVRGQTRMTRACVAAKRRVGEKE